VKIKLLIAWISLGVMRVSAQQTHLDIKVPDAIENDLRGAVKSTQTTYKKQRYSGSSARQTEEERTCTYDEKGNMLTLLTRDITDVETNRVEYSYDATGCLTGRLSEALSKSTNSPVVKRYAYSIDPGSRQILRRNLETGAFEVTAYSPAGYAFYEEEWSSSNTLTEAVQIKRLPNHKEYEEVTFSGETNKTKTARMRWNSHGLQKEYISEKHGTNGYIFVTRYTHPEKDATGNWTRRIARTDLIEEKNREAYSEEIAVRKIDYFTPPFSVP